MRAVQRANPANQLPVVEGAVDRSGVEVGDGKVQRRWAVRMDSASLPSAIL
jgi:hypothetical protein